MPLYKKLISTFRGINLLHLSKNICPGEDGDIRAYGKINTTRKRFLKWIRDSTGFYAIAGIYSINIFFRNCLVADY
jgi:hypothetical protein